VRMTFHQTDICIVNSHLPAHQLEIEKRNKDFHEICNRLEFFHHDKSAQEESTSSHAKTIEDHTMNFWLGDLNYRLNDLTIDQVKKMVKEKRFSQLLEHDQLTVERKQMNVFVGYREGPVNFRPTYKYDPGTSNWDSSESIRTPAWTDRILWRGEHVFQTEYRSHENLTVSDHKPVSATFKVGVKVVDRVKRQKVKEEIEKELEETPPLFDGRRFKESFYGIMNRSKGDKVKADSPPPLP